MSGLSVMPWAQLAWALRLRPGREFDAMAQQRAALACSTWLERWARRNDAVISHRSIRFASTESALIVHCRALLYVPADGRVYVEAEVNARAAVEAAMPQQPATPVIARATAADLEAIKRSQA